MSFDHILFEKPQFVPGYLLVSEVDSIHFKSIICLKLFRLTMTNWKETKNRQMSKLQFYKLKTKLFFNFKFNKVSLGCGWCLFFYALCISQR